MHNCKKPSCIQIGKTYSILTKLIHLLGDALGDNAGERFDITNKMRLVGRLHVPSG
jgi:hypothetical protein